MPKLIFFSFLDSLGSNLSENDGVQIFPTLTPSLGGGMSPIMGNPKIACVIHLMTGFTKT